MYKIPSTNLWISGIL